MIVSVTILAWGIQPMACVAANVRQMDHRSRPSTSRVMCSQQSSKSNPLASRHPSRWKLARLLPVRIHNQHWMLADTNPEDPPLVPQVTSDPPSLPSDPPAEVLSVVWESTTAPDITTQFTTERRTSATYDEITLFLTAHTTASRASSSTSESETPNVERDNDDPPTPSQVLQADAGGLMDQNILYMGALAFVVAAAV